MNKKTTANPGRSVSAIVTICLSIACALGMLLCSAVPPTFGYAADAGCQITGLSQNHSSFHYEFTRVLAAAAGFNAPDSETIAVACEATDTGGFTGYPIAGGAITVTFDNTQRLTSPNPLFYHFARRAGDYPITREPNGQVYPGALQNTCGYFTQNTTNAFRAPCADPQVGELDKIREWAINGAALPSGTAPTVAASSNIPHDSNGNMKGQNLVALGIYLHAIADSYSHEKCMIQEQVRNHLASPYSCTGTWHVSSEFGQYENSGTTIRGAGVPFTQTAATALWREILRYRSVNSPGPTVWDEGTYQTFAREFISLSNAADRVQKAIAAFNQLTGETVTAQPCASSKTKYRPKRGTIARSKSSK